MAAIPHSQIFKSNFQFYIIFKLEEGYVTTKRSTNKKQVMNRIEASKILGNTPYMKGFHFYNSIGNYTEETATSLSEFAKVLETINEGSILFHFQRQDFQKWIRDVLADSELADRIGKIKPTPSAEDLRQRLVETVRTRITELEKLVAE
jgi:hypothetical protein